MHTLTYIIDINAPKEKVWDVMLADATYREWTAAFHEGSYYDGSWDKGSKIRFLADDDGQPSGMSSQIEDNIPYEYLSIVHLGEVIDGKEDLTSEGALQWAGGHENYIFNEDDGVTRLTIELEPGSPLPDDVIEMFDDMWPPALQKLKEIAERP